MILDALIDATWWRWRAGVTKKKLAKVKAHIVDLQSQEDDNFSRLLGVMTREWSMVESALDICNFYAIHTPEGRGITAELPRSLNPKVDVFKKTHRRVAALLDIRDQGLALAALVTELKTKRHDFIHGLVLTVPGPGSRLRRVQRIVYDGALLDLTEREFSMDDMIELGMRISQLSDALCDHRALVVHRLGPK